MLASIYRTGRGVYAGTLACSIVYITSRLAGLDHQHTSAKVPPLLLSSTRLLACMVYVSTRVRGEQTFGMYVRDHAVLVPALYIAHKPRLLWGTVGI